MAANRRDSEENLTSEVPLGTRLEGSDRFAIQCNSGDENRLSSGVGKLKRCCPGLWLHGFSSSQGVLRDEA